MHSSKGLCRVYQKRLYVVQFFSYDIRQRFQALDFGSAEIRIVRYADDIHGADRRSTHEAGAVDLQWQNLLDNSCRRFWVPRGQVMDVADESVFPLAIEAVLGKARDAIPS